MLDTSVLTLLFQDLNVNVVNDVTIFRFVITNPTLQVRCKYVYDENKRSGFLVIVDFNLHISKRFYGKGSKILNNLISFFYYIHKNILNNENKLKILIFNYNSLLFWLKNNFKLKKRSEISEKEYKFLYFNLIYFLNNFYTFNYNKNLSSEENINIQLKKYYLNFKNEMIILFKRIGSNFDKQVLNYIFEQNMKYKKINKMINNIFILEKSYEEDN